MTDSERSEIVAACDTAMRLNIPIRELVARIRGILAPRSSDSGTGTAEGFSWVHNTSPGFKVCDNDFPAA